MTTLQLTCKSCGKPVPAEDVNIDKLIAKCRACNAVFGIADLAGGAPQQSDDAVPMPKCFVVENWGPELSLTRHWYSHALWIMVPFCIIWDGFLIVWFSASFGVIFGQPDALIAGLFMLLFSVLHVAVGVVITYATVCGFMNRTVLRVSGGELTVRHGPLPFPGNPQVLTADIKQLYCTETVHRGKRSRRSSYNVLVVTRDNDKITLVSNLDELEHGLFIEQQVERYLNIRDKRVPGQVRV